MVRKIDPEAIPALEVELAAKARSRRLRAITVAAAMGAVPDLEQAFIARLVDEDHVVRAEAARSLAACQSGAARQALLEACGDRSLVVREAAEESLERLRRAGRGSTAASMAATRASADKGFTPPPPPSPPVPGAPLAPVTPLAPLPPLPWEVES